MVAKYGASGVANIGGAMIGVGAVSLGFSALEAAGLGGLAVATLDRVGSEVIDWKITPRQEMRAGRVYIVACQKLKEELAAGATIRDDGFFDVVDGRSGADEVLEAAIRAAMEASQEQKIDFIGALWARLAINPHIDLATCHMLLEAARTLSFRGYVLLKLVAEKASLSLPVRGEESLPGPSIKFEPLMVDIYDLTRRGLLIMKDEGSPDMYAILGYEKIDPAKLALSTVGQLLYDNLDLKNLAAASKFCLEVVDGLRAIAQSGRGHAKLDGSFSGGYV